MATFIRTDGRTAEIRPKGKAFSLEDLQAFVGGTIDVQELAELTGERKQMVVNDEGKLMELPKNEIASIIWQRAYPIEKYPHNNDGLIVGDVLIATPEELGEDEEEGA